MTGAVGAPEAREGALQEPDPARARERLLGVVASEFPRLGDARGGAHDCSRTATVMAPGSTLALSFLTFLRSPPSSSYGTLRSSEALTFFAFVTWTNGDFAVEPTAVR